MTHTRYLICLFALACAPATNIVERDDAAPSLLPDYTDTSFDTGTTDSVENEELAEYSVLLGLYLADAGLLREVAESGLARSEAEGRGIFFAEMDLTRYDVPTLDELMDLYPPEVIESRGQPVEGAEDGAAPPPYGTQVCSTCTASYLYYNPYMYRMQTADPCAGSPRYFLAVGCSALCRCG